jgi:hypothetical protein
MRHGVILFGAAGVLSGCLIDLPEPDKGSFACATAHDCTNGYICDGGTNRCTPAAITPCTGSGCTSSTTSCPGSSCTMCSNRGMACQQVGGATGVCANVKGSDNVFILACAACPATCSTTCLEAAGSDKPVEQGSQCSGSQQQHCTDLDCTCSASNECSPTLTCTAGKCADPCAAWPCTRDQTCTADKTTNAAACSLDCRATYGRCFGDTSSSQDRTCKDATGLCVLTGGASLKVLSVRPAPDSLVAANSRVRISFNMPVKTSTLSDATVYIDTASGSLVSTQRSLPDDHTVELVPSAGQFASGVGYRIHVLHGVTCNSNMALDRDVLSPFLVF